MNELAPETVCAVLIVAVINQEIAVVKVFVMGEDETFLGGFSEVFLDPRVLIYPGRRVVLGGSGEDISIEVLR